MPDGLPLNERVTRIETQNEMLLKGQDEARTRHHAQAQTLQVMQGDLRALVLDAKERKEADAAAAKRLSELEARVSPIEAFRAAFTRARKGALKAGGFVGGAFLTALFGGEQITKALAWFGSHWK